MKQISTLKSLILVVAFLLMGMGNTWAQEADKDTVVTVPETGYLAVKPSRNFTGPKGVVVCSMFGSNSSGLSFTTYGLDTVVVASSSSSNSGLFLIAKPGQYTLKLTDAEATGRINSTSVSWQQEPGQAYKKNRRLYKFVNEPGRIGFVRDAKYAADNYQYCDLAEGEHIYLPLADNNLKKAAELLNTTPEALDFIPWAGPWNKVFTVDDLPSEMLQAADIASFIALADGETVKLMLKDARVNGFNDLSSTYYIEDATGALAIKGVTLTKGTKLNGYIVGKKSTEDVDYVNTPSQGLEYQLTVDASQSEYEAVATELVGTEMTIAEASQQANYGRLVTLNNVSIAPIGNGRNVQITDAVGNIIKARDLFGVLPSDYTWPAKASKFTGIALYYMTGWFVMPISSEAIVAASQATEVTFDFASATIRENIGTALTDVKGNIYNETFTYDNVSLQVTSGSAASKLYTDANRGQCLVIYPQFTTLTFKAPADYAITKIEFTAAGNSNINKFTASSGAIEGMVWTGNAEGVRFLQGATSYLANAVVTLAAKDASTAALPAIEYKECANIAAFNTLSAGEYAKVTLTDAEVIGKSADGYSTVWIQDATGGCWIQYTSLNDKLAEKTKINGYVYVIARPNSGNVQMKEAEATLESQITATEISDYTIVEGTLAEVNVAANLNKVVKITGAALEETSATAGKLTQGDASIDVNNGNVTANQQLHKVAEWAKDTKLENVTIVAILVGKSATANQLLPISITAGGTGIANVNAEDINNVAIYNLQGVRLSQLQRGLNIVNGKKVVIK